MAPTYRRTWTRGWSPSQNADPERLIGIGRLLISTFALAAVYLDPTQPANLLGAAYWILSGYIVISVIFLAVRPVRPFDTAYKLATTACDIGTVGVLVYITGELESPFFTFYTFLLLSAAIRWEWAGTLIVAATLQGILFLVGMPDIEDGESELNFLILRSVFCWVIVLLLGYFASYRNRSNLRLRELASWPHEIVPEEDRPWLSSSLRHAARVLGARTIVVLWRDRDQEVQHAAIWDGSVCRFLDHISIAELASDQPAPNDTNEVSGELRDRILARLPADLGLSLQDWRQVFIAGFGTIRFNGCVIVADPDACDRDTSVLTRIVASRIAVTLEHFSLTQEFASAASLRERVRLARDLHDSILQDLAAAVLQIDAAQRSEPTDPSAMSRVNSLLQAIQTRIRRLVSETREHPGNRRPLADQLQMFVAPLGEQWGCRVLLEVEPPDLAVSEAIATELCLALSEATANAARHGRASRLTIMVAERRRQLQVVIEDDGTGGGAEQVPYPASIGTRVEELGGTLAIERPSTGLRLQITIPLRRPAR